MSRIWVRDHWHGGWITLFWKQLHRIAAPFGELAWDHARRGRPEATEEQLADAVAGLLKRASEGPVEGGGAEGLSQRDRRVAARATASLAARAGPGPASTGSRANHQKGNAQQEDDASDGGEEAVAVVIPLPIFDPFAEADKRW